MTAPEGFGALILTHGRPDRVKTLRLLRRHGYTGPVWLVIDDEDPTGDEYRRLHGAESVIEFSKSEAATLFDPCDLSTDRRAIAYARVAAFGIARDLGLTHFVQLDDDYTTLRYRVRSEDALAETQVYRSTYMRSLDDVFAALVRLLEDTGALTVAMAQGGDHIGGPRNPMLRQGFKRKAMNTFVVRTDRPVPFVGRLNEDVNAYALWGSRGELFLTVSAVQIEQLPTQSNAGGMTELYRDSGTYVKSFYTVMLCPSFVQVRTMGPVDHRMHHHFDWEHAVPKILDPRLRRLDDG